MFILENKDGEAILAELAVATDRSAAILGASIVDVELTAMIRRFLRDDPKLFAEAINGNGFLSSFSARINIAYMINIYGNTAYADLNLIRKVRNDFAHDLRKGDFEEGSIRGRCAALKAPDDYTFEYGGDLKHADGRPQVAIKGLAGALTTPRGRYLVACEVYGAVFRHWNPLVAKFFEAPPSIGKGER
ncbi:hypothetical protein [Phreatobacter sp.]|uniref:hypothetical protein n=1 Tax=Phreatobacter sp. TaxID=1966341 RepID=UPI0025F5CFE6|nr:hypothetical protein [Phreatobacter sp.]